MDVPVIARVAQVDAELSVALDRAGMTVFRDITFLAAGPASERTRSAKEQRWRWERLCCTASTATRFTS